MAGGEEMSDTKALDLNSTTDARIWVDEWLKIIKDRPAIPTDEGTMLAWFASAIMAGYDFSQNKAAAELKRLEAESSCTCGQPLGYHEEEDEIEFCPTAPTIRFCKEHWDKHWLEFQDLRTQLAQAQALVEEKDRLIVAYGAHDATRIQDVEFQLAQAQEAEDEARVLLKRTEWHKLDRAVIKHYCWCCDHLMGEHYPECELAAWLSAHEVKK